MSANDAWNYALVHEAQAVQRGFEERHLAPGESGTAHDYAEVQAWEDAYKQAEVLTKLDQLGLFNDTNADILAPYYGPMPPYARRDLYGQFKNMALAHIDEKNSGSGVGQAGPIGQPGFGGFPTLNPIPNLPGLPGTGGGGAPTPEPAPSVPWWVWLAGGGALAYAALKVFRG